MVALTAPTAFEPEPAMGAVSAARAALDNVVRSLAFDLAPRGIRINAVGVGLIDTPRQQDRFATAAGNGGDYQEWLAREPKGGVCCWLGLARQMRWQRPSCSCRHG